MQRTTTLLLVLWLTVLPVAAEPLRLETVLSSADAHYPAIIEAEQRRLSALAGIDTARAAFDPRVRSGVRARLSGFYDGRHGDVTMRQRLRAGGAELYGGYRASRGILPIYEDEYLTNSGGEFKAGIAVPLLRDRRIDDERFAMLASELEVDGAAQDITLARLDVQRLATQRYKNWLAAGFRLAVYQDLLAIADARTIALEKRVALGDAAQLLVEDNERNVLRRRKLVNAAELGLVEAAQGLSLFLRDRTGAPLVATPNQLPEDWLTNLALPASASDVEIARTLDRHPDVRALDIELAELDGKLALARNKLAPKLDLALEVSSELGNGSETRAGTDTIFALQFEIPVGLRAQRAKVSSLRAEREGLRAQRRFTTESLQAMLDTLVARMTAHLQGHELAVAALEQTRLLERAERERFEQGDSDFFLLNLREEMTAEAAIERIDIAERFFLARADFSAQMLEFLDQSG